MEIWKVKDTPSFPNRWKVYPTHTYQETNDTSNYFSTLIQAQQEAERRNSLVSDCLTA